MFKVNEGPIDRALRTILGVVVLVIGVLNSLWYLIVIGAILLFTAITGFCGLYALLGINTCPRKLDNDSKKEEWEYD